MAEKSDTTPAYPIASVGNALRLLLMLQEQERLTVTEGARALGVAPSTAHRLLAMLTHYDFVARSPDGRSYRPGGALVGLGLSAVRSFDLRRLAHPHLVALSTELEETVSLIMLEGRWVRFVDSVEGSRALRIASRTGLRLPAHVTSAGKAILAQLTPAELDVILPANQPLPGRTNASITSRQQLDPELDRVRRRGYGTNLEESEPDISAIGVAIPDAGGRPRAGLGVSMPASRMNECSTEDIVAALIRTTGNIARALDEDSTAP